MAETGDIVYFRYASNNLKWMYNGNEIPPGGNAGNLNQSASFIYGNYQLSSSSQYGQGVQIPLQFVGNNSEVNLVLRSYYGFKGDSIGMRPISHLTSNISRRSTDTASTIH